MQDTKASGNLKLPEARAKLKFSCLFLKNNALRPNSQICEILDCAISQRTYE